VIIESRGVQYPGVNVLAFSGATVQLDANNPARVIVSSGGGTGGGLHAASHQSGGTDPITIDASQVTGLAAVAVSGSASDLGAGTLPDGRLSGNVIVVSGDQSISGIKTFAPGGATDTYTKMSANGPEMYRHFTSNSGPVLTQIKSRGTEGGPSGVVANDILGGFLGRGHNGTAYSAGQAGVRAKADGTWEVGSHPTRVAMEATDSGSTLIREILVCYGSGRVHIPLGELELDGALNHDGSTWGIYGTTPVTQGAALTDLATDGSATSAQLATAINAINNRLRRTGFVAT
jgi:hypothetical protein